MSRESNDMEKIIKKSSNGVKNQVVKRGVSLMMFPIEVMKAVAQDINTKLKNKIYSSWYFSREFTLC